MHASTELAPRGSQSSHMNKVIIFGSALLCSTVVTNASWVSGGAAKGSEKSVSSLSAMVEERSVVLGSLKAATETKAATLGTFASASQVSSSKAISTKWKDASGFAGLSEMNTALVLAKNDSDPVPEAGTWAGAAVVALAAYGGWRSRRTHA